MVNGMVLVVTVSHISEEMILLASLIDSIAQFQNRLDIYEAQGSLYL